MPMLVKAAGMVATLYVLVATAAWLGQRRLMYVPDQQRVAPAELGLSDVRETMLEAPDGARLVAWRSPAADNRPTILYFHGNAGNLASRAERFQRYQRQGFGLLMMSWRSYSGSTGHPTEAHNVADALMAYDTLRADGIPAGRIAIYGESLGSGVALQVAKQRPVAAVVLDAPYTSVVEVASMAYPYLPVRPLLLDRYESDRHILSLKAPLLVLHGQRDTIIPVRMGKALYAAAPEPKKLVLFPNGGHVDLDQFGAADVVGKWLDEILPDTRLQ